MRCWGAHDCGRHAGSRAAGKAAAAKAAGACLPEALLKQGSPLEATTSASRAAARQRSLTGLLQALLGGPRVHQNNFSRLCRLGCCAAWQQLSRPSSL